MSNSLWLADGLFHLLHISMIVVNSTFWMWKRTLRLAQVALFLTSASWFGFGILYGWGYCFLTDWHWQVKEARGERDLPLSYMEYSLEQMLPFDFSSGFVNALTALVYVASVFGCVYRSWEIKKARTLNPGF